MYFINGRFYTQRLTGTQRFASEIVKRIFNQDECKILMPNKPIKEEYNFNINEASICKYANVNGAVWDQVVLPSFMRKNKQLLVNFCNTAPFSYLNKISSIMDISPIQHPEWFNRYYSSYYKILIPRILKTSKKIITISEFSKRSIIEHYKIPDNKIEIIHCSISNNFMNAENLDGRALLEKHGLTSKQYILGVSSLDPRKNFTNLIKAYSQLNISSIDLVVIGGGANIFKRHDLTYHISKKNNIKFLGYVTDQELSIIYKNALCFAYPSFYEGFGMPPLEAMFYNCPVLTSNCTSLPEICGEAALYVNPNNISEICSGLRELINDTELRKMLIKNGKEQIKKFSWDESAKKAKKIINEYA